MSTLAFNSLFGEDDPKRMPSHLFFSSHKIDYSTAQRADISRQNYSVCPRHWYIDAAFICRGCGEEFTFTADEQRFWYEDRHFWIDSLPTKCIPCRKQQRTRLELRKQYDTLITTALGPCSPEMKKEVVAIINELVAAGDKIPMKMEQNLNTLYAQLAAGCL